MSTRLIKKLITVGLICAAGLANAEGDSEAGKVKVHTCKGCHGIPGYMNTYPTYNVPHIGGQHANYVYGALKAYASGARKHPSMLGNSVSLSDQDMQDIGAYVSRFRAMNVDVPVTGNAAAGRAKVEACGSCHGEDGNSLDTNYPRLAGQYESFLIKALQEYKSGARANAIMKSMAESLSDEDIRDISAFYASQRRGLTVIPE